MTAPTTAAPPPTTSGPASDRRFWDDRTGRLPGHDAQSPTLRVLRGFVAAIVDLGVGSLLLFVRLFPQLFVIWLIGWLIEQLSLRITTQIPLDLVWLGLLVFAFGLLGTLGAIVLMLRLIAEELQLWELVPSDDADHSVSHILAVTLLPFLGIYAAVDAVAGRVDTLRALNLFQTGFLSDETILTAINPTNDGPAKLIFVIGLIALTYVGRRVVDLLHERTGWRILGIGVTVLEAYFLLLLIMSGTILLTRAADFVGDRMVTQWLDDAGTAITGFFAGIGFHWPPVFSAVTAVLLDVIWPLFRDALAQPVIWLAVAALVFGSKVLSTADLWRQGQPLSAQVPTPPRLRRLQQARRRTAVTGSVRGRRVWLEFQELFLGDIDDKYLPTVQSLRLIVKSGAIFLGAYVLVYAAVELVASGWNWVLLHLIGGHPVVDWLVYGTGIDIITTGIFEPLRICLLGLAFHRCLAIFRDRAVAVPTHPIGVTASQDAGR